MAKKVLLTNEGLQRLQDELDNLKNVNVIIKNDLENLPRVVIITKEWSND